MMPNQFLIITQVLLTLFLALTCQTLSTLNTSQLGVVSSGNSSRLDVIIPHCKSNLDPCLSSFVKSQRESEEQDVFVHDSHLSPILWFRPTDNKCIQVSIPNPTALFDPQISQTAKMLCALLSKSPDSKTITASVETQGVAFKCQRAGALGNA